MKTKYSNFQKEKGQRLEATSMLTFWPTSHRVQGGEMGQTLRQQPSSQHIRAAQILLFSKNFRQFWFGLESFLGIHFKPWKQHRAFGLPGLWFVGLLVL